MKRKEVKRKVDDAFTNATPNNLEQLKVDVSGCEQAAVSVKTNKGKKFSLFKKLALTAMCAVLVVGGGLGIYGYNLEYGAASEIALDVNPSITITLNSKERVLGVKANNQDAQLIINGLDFTGDDYKTVVNEIVEALVDAGYISEYANSVLVSVKDGVKNRGEKVEQALLTEIDKVFTNHQFEGAVISQNLMGNYDLEKLAREYGITMGKANLIDKIIKASMANPQGAYQFSELVGLTVNELNVLMQTLKVTADDLNTQGKVEIGCYIDKETAKQKALEYVGEILENALNIECEFEFSHGVIVYEVSFEVLGKEYECKINATTGELVAVELELNIGAGLLLTPELRKQAILTYFTITDPTLLEDFREILDEDEYKITFKYNDFYYNFEIEDGVITEVEWAIKPNNTGTIVENNFITQEKAQELATAVANKLVERLGLTDVTIQLTEVDLPDNDDPREKVKYYEFEFTVGNFEFEIKVNAVTGAIARVNDFHH